MDTIIIYPVTLTLEFDLSLNFFTFANNFWTVSARALIFEMSISYDKTIDGYQYFLHYDLDFGAWPTFWKNKPC